MILHKTSSVEKGNARSLFARLTGRARKKTSTLGQSDRHRALRDEAVDIVVCVHDAQAWVARCLEAILASTEPPYRLILVDDGSAVPTQELLKSVSTRTGAVLIRHEVARGYTGAANAGLAASAAPWVVLLNSDTQVTQGWLERMWAHGRRDPRVGIIGPVSNCAAWQSAPRLNGGGEWRSAQVPSGFSVEEMGALCATLEDAGVPIPFINGFCYMIRRAVLDQVGLLDDVNFPIGYGEEHDYSIRAAAAGWTSLVAGDAYVYHRGSQSFGRRRRDELIELHERALRIKHDPAQWIDAQADSCRTSLGMASLRARLACEMDRVRIRRRFRTSRPGSSIAFVVPPVGAPESPDDVWPQAIALARMGMRVTLLRHGPLAPCSEVRNANVRGLGFATEALLNNHISRAGYGAVIAPALSPRYRLPDRDANARTTMAYHTPRLEPWILPGSIDDASRAFRDYVTGAPIALFAHTGAIVEEVEIYTGRTPVLLPPTIDPDVFHFVHDDASADVPLVLAAMLRPEEPEPNVRMLSALEKASAALAGRVAIELFGLSETEMSMQGLSPPGGAVNHGRVNAASAAAILRRSAILLDLAEPYTMHGAALNAMASGCAIVAGHCSGVASHSRHLQDAWIVDNGDVHAAAAALVGLAHDTSLRSRLRRSGLETALRYCPEAAAAALANSLFQ